MPDQNASSPISPQAVKYMEEDEIKPKQSKYNGSEKLSPMESKLSPTGSSSGGNGSANGGRSSQMAVMQDSMISNASSEIHIEQYGKLGSIFFKLRYLAERNALMVSIIRCRGLPSKSSGGNNTNNASTSNNSNDIPAGMNGRTQAATDPYVKLQLLPDKQHKVKTRVVRNTRNPVYDEDFTFYGLNINDLQNMSLHFVILSFDRYSRDDVIGEVVCPLSTIEIGDISKEALSISKEIQPRSLKIRAQGRGELLISLCWQPAAGRLTVVLLKARNLPRMDVTGLADPYVKIYLLYNGQRIAKKKTHVKKRTLSPVFNESFAFDIPAAEVRQWEPVEVVEEIHFNIHFSSYSGYRSYFGRSVT